MRERKEYHGGSEHPGGRHKARPWALVLDQDNRHLSVTETRLHKDTEQRVLHSGQQLQIRDTGARREHVVFDQEIVREEVDPNREEYNRVPGSLMVHTIIS